MPLVLLCRHGTTALNKGSAGESDERIRGWSDVPLDEQGKKDAEILAKKSAKFPIERIYSSTLDRAMETANAIGEQFSLPVEETRALMPWDLGYMTKQRVKDVLPAMKKFIKAEDSKVPGGESFSNFRVRTLKFVQKCIQEAQNDQKTICLVSHTRVCQLVKAWLAAGAPGDFHIDDATMDDYSDEIAPGGFLEIEPGEVLGPEFKDGKREKADQSVEE